jgi:HmuY protein
MRNNFFTLILSITAVLAFTACSDDDGPSQPIEIIIEGASVAPEVGGPNQPNQVYIDLSTNTTSTAKRDSWDLGFYSGTDFRVVINGAIAIATAQLEATDINVVNSTTPEVQAIQPGLKIGVAGSDGYVDSPDGNILETAISEISSVAADNHVYLVNLGFEVGTSTPAIGSIALNGTARGWKKIRTLRSGNNYVLQYADLDDTTFEEVTITKDPAYNFTFFSFNTETEVDVEPEKSKWDLTFTVFTNVLNFGGGMFGGYSYPDFVVNNTKTDVQAYMIDTLIETSLTYDNFTIANVVDANFSIDQRTIGSSWRNGGGPGTLPSLKDTVFYIVKDTDGNLYKLKFLSLTNEVGQRGYPKFVYSLLK